MARSRREMDRAITQFPSRSNGCGELVRAMGFALALQIDLPRGGKIGREHE